MEDPKVDSKQHPADFETAIQAAGFGKFNIFLLIASLPLCWSTMFQTMTMSYVFPAAQCDLNLNLEDKGMLNAITFAGMMSSGLLWGFLFDTYGRRKLLLVGFLCDGIFVVLSAFSQNLTFLLVTKFLGGFMIAGPFSALVSYLSEFHSSEYRTRVPMVMGIYYATGGIYLPLVGSLILSRHLEIYLTDYLVVHSWSVFLLINALPSFLSSVILIFLPESPRFLMTIGENDEALNVFRRIYTLNSGNSEKYYPYEVLLNENNKEETRSSKTSLKFDLGQIRQLFVPPLLGIFVLVCSLQILLVTSYNSLKLWIPQIFQSINDYKMMHNGSSSTLCEMLGTLRRNTQNQDCYVNFDNFEVYFNAMIVGTAAMILYLIFGTIINILGQNKSLTLLSFCSCLFATGIYLAPNDILSTITIAGYYSLSSVGTVVSAIVIVNQFPTKLRATTLAFSMIFSKITTMIGNMVFPFLLEIGCAPAFLTLAVLELACTIITLLLPRPKQNFE